MNPSVTHQHGNVGNVAWDRTSQYGRRDVGGFARAALRTIGVVLRGVFTAVFGLILGLMHFAIILGALATGVLLVPAAIFGVLVAFVLLFHGFSWLLEALGLL